MNRVRVFLLAFTLFVNFPNPSMAAEPGSVVSNVEIKASATTENGLVVTWNNPTFSSTDKTDFYNYQIKVYRSDTSVLVDDQILTDPNLLNLTSVSVNFYGTEFENGQSYYATVRIRYVAANTSEIRSLAAATPYGLPNQPDKPTVARTSAGEVTLTWSKPVENGSAIYQYKIICEPSCSSEISSDVATSINPLEKVINGLNSSTSYTFKVKAVNERGESLLSLASNAVTPHDAVSPPLSIQVTAGNGSATASWSPVTVAGATVSGYTANLVSSSDLNSISQTKNVPASNAPNVTFTGLTNGQSYLVKVYTTANSLNSSPKSSVVFTPTAPYTPPKVDPPAIETPATTPVVEAPAPAAAPAPVPAAPSGPAPMAKGAKPSLASVAQNIGMNVPAKSKVTVVVSRASKKICKTQGSKLVATASGPCTVTVTVKAPKPAAVTKAGAFAVTGGTLTADQVAVAIGTSIPAKARVSISVVGSSKKVCSASGSKVKVKSAGICSVKMKIQAPQPGPVKQTSTITVN